MFAFDLNVLDVAIAFILDRGTDQHDAVETTFLPSPLLQLYCFESLLFGIDFNLKFLPKNSAFPYEVACKRGSTF